MSQDCEVCKPPPLPPRDESLPGVPLEFMPGGTRHRSDCPLVPQLSAEARRRLNEFMDDVARCQRRAWAEAQNYWIGGDQ